MTLYRISGAHDFTGWYHVRWLTIGGDIVVRQTSSGRREERARVVYLRPLRLA